MKKWQVFVCLLVLAGCGSEPPIVGVEVGEQAPDFSLMDAVYHQMVTLDQYRGIHHVVLVFHTGNL